MEATRKSIRQTKESDNTETTPVGETKHYSWSPTESRELSEKVSEQANEREGGRDATR